MELQAPERGLIGTPLGRRWAVLIRFPEMMTRSVLTKRAPKTGLGLLPAADFSAGLARFFLGGHGLPLLAQGQVADVFGPAVDQAGKAGTVAGE